MYTCLVGFSFLAQSRLALSGNWVGSDTELFTPVSQGLELPTHRQVQQITLKVLEEKLEQTHLGQG